MGFSSTTVADMYDPKIWNSQPAKGARTINLLGMDLDMVILDENHLPQGSYTVKDSESGQKVKGKRSKYANDLLIALPIVTRIH